MVHQFTPKIKELKQKQCMVEMFAILTSKVLVIKYLKHR